MGYRIGIDSNHKGSLLCYPNKLASLLLKFDLKPKMNGNKIDFFFREGEEFAIFYTKGVSLWINTTDEKQLSHLIQLLVDIAREFNDGSQVVGDQGEVYLSATVCYEFPYQLDKPKYPLWLSNHWGKILLVVGIMIEYCLIYFYKR